MGRPSLSSSTRTLGTLKMPFEVFRLPNHGCGVLLLDSWMGGCFSRQNGFNTAAGSQLEDVNNDSTIMKSMEKSFGFH